MAELMDEHALRDAQIGGDTAHAGPVELRNRTDAGEMLLHGIESDPRRIAGRLALGGTTGATRTTRTSRCTRTAGATRSTRTRIVSGFLGLRQRHALEVANAEQPGVIRHQTDLVDRQRTRLNGTDFLAVQQKRGAVLILDHLNQIFAAQFRCLGLVGDFDVLATNDAK